MFYAYAATPKYESKARLLLLPKTFQDLVLTAGKDERQVIRQVTPEDLNTEFDLIRSTKVIKDTILSFPDNQLGLKIQNQGLFDKARESISTFVNSVLVSLSLKKNVKTSQLNKNISFIQNSIGFNSYESNVLEVSLKAEDPKQTKIVLERLLEKYIKHHNRVFSVEKSEEFYEDQSHIYNDRLAMAEKAFKNFQQTNNILNFDKQNEANITLFTELNKELQLLSITFEEENSKIQIFEQSMRGNNEVLITKDMRMMPTITSFEESIVPLLIKRSEISKTFTKSSREYQDIDDQVKMLYGEMRNEIKKITKSNKLELKSMGVRIASLQNKIDQIKKQASELKEKERTYTELKRQVDFHKQNYLLYATKTEKSRVYEEKKHRNISNVAIVDSPSLPVLPVSPKKILLLILSFFFGSIAALCLPFILESFDSKLKTVDDVEILLDLPVISSFSKVK